MAASAEPTPQPSTRSDQPGDDQGPFQRMTGLDCPTALEQALVEQASQGVDRAVEQLFHRIQPYVTLVVRSQLSPQLRRLEEIDDVCQVVLLHILRDLPRFEYRGRQPFRTWIRLIVTREIQDLYRHYQSDKRSSRKTVSLEDLLVGTGYVVVEELEELVATTRSVATTAERREMTEILGDSIADLPSEQAEALRLIKLDQLTHQQAAEFMGISKRHVSRLVHQGMARLAFRLRGQWP